MPSGIDDGLEPVLPSLTLSLPAARVRDGSRPRGAHKGDLVGGRYVVDGQIGRGAMGRVLRVHHGVLGKAFALKLPRAGLAADAELKARFHREAKLASSLSHDHICSVVDFGEDDHFGLFMVMELLEGVRLDYKIRQDGALPPKVACDVISQVAEALRFVHGRGILHGDIKSENILLTRTSEKRRMVKLLDFGLARLSTGEHSGGIEGTPEYLAPERIEGTPPTAQSDIYALGILFWELLVGRLPFTGKMEQVFAGHRSAAIPRPSSQIERPLDERADLIIARATAKQPEDRHADVAGFLYELRTLMAMEGMDVGRRRADPRGPRVTDRQAGNAERSPLASEIFALAPIPLAAVDIHGKIRVANRAFSVFVGLPDATGAQLAETGLLTLHPALLDDVQLAASEHAPVKRILYLRDERAQVVEAALLITPTSQDTEDAAIHLAIHPLSVRG